MFTLKTISTGSQDGNCYLISNGKEGILLDCGCKPSQILKGIDFNPSQIAACLITHEHGDHCKSVKKVYEYGIPCYSGEKTQEFIRNVYGIEIHGTPEKKWQTVGRFKFCSFELPHDGTPNRGFLIDLPDGRGRLLYATDFEYLPYSFKTWGINFWLIECNYFEDLVDKEEVKYSHSLRGHCSLGTLKEIIRVNRSPKMRNAVLCHFSLTWCDIGRAKHEIESETGEVVAVDIADPAREIKLKLYPWEN